MIFKEILDLFSAILKTSRTRPENHALFLERLGQIFRQRQLETIYEYEIAFSSKVRRKQFVKQNGFIDLYVVTLLQEDIAVEFETGRKIKWKSLEKLLQCPAQSCFGIVMGKSMFKANMERVWETYATMVREQSEMHSFDSISQKKLFIGSVSDKLLVQVNLKAIHDDIVQGKDKDYFIKNLLKYYILRE